MGSYAEPITASSKWQEHRGNRTEVAMPSRTRTTAKVWTLGRDFIPHRWSLSALA